MRIMVFHRRTLMVGVTILIALIVTLCIGNHKTQTVANVNRDLPIYCVDTGDKKRISISFDAAWGNGRYGVPFSGI